MRQRRFQQLDSGHCWGYRSGWRGSARPCRCDGLRGFLRGLAGIVGEAVAGRQQPADLRHGLQVNECLPGLAGVQFGQRQPTHKG